MRALTRPGLLLLFASAGFAVMGDASETFGPRLSAAVTLSALSAFLGLACLFIGRREDGDLARVRLTRVAAVLWGLSLVLAGVGTALELRGASGGSLLAALGGAAFATIPVLAAWRLGARLARVALAAGAALAALAYLGAAALALRDVALPSAALPGDLLLFAGYWMTYRTYRPRER